MKALYSKNITEDLNWKDRDKNIFDSMFNHTKSILGLKIFSHSYKRINVLEDKDKSIGGFKKIEENG